MQTFITNKLTGFQVQTSFAAYILCQRDVHAGNPGMVPIAQVSHDLHNVHGFKSGSPVLASEFVASGTLG